MTAALERIGQLRTFDVSELDLSGLRPARITALARHATTARAREVAGLVPDRRIAFLLAFAVVSETRATDDALDLFCELLRGLIARVERRGRAERLDTLADLDAAALALRVDEALSRIGEQVSAPTAGADVDPSAPLRGTDDAVAKYVLAVRGAASDLSARRARRDALVKWLSREGSSDDRRPDQMSPDDAENLAPVKKSSSKP